MSIDYELTDGVALITINRPERANAMDAEHYAGLSAAWQQVRDDNAVRAAIITGAGERVFSAGADLTSWVGREKQLSDHWLTQKDPLLNRGLEVWKPVICAINGACVGGGMTLMLATDLRVAVKGARFGLSEVKRGIIAANGGTQRIMRQMPYAIAMEMLLLGEDIDAEMALRWGLINRVVEREDLIPTALDLAARIGANAPLAVRAAKELAVKSQDMTLSEGLRMEQFVNHILHASEDTRRAKEAFAEKRRPVFEGN
ncbi:enoyl-CoA hydratase/isomerase family protein [Paracoccus sp. AS002]|uniref:enoyl-CoA hydratase/isomerase family protein n=1 Tax=Paracoccus sp. AS002 TaxID=3019545 RepID=UPI0023E7BA36|nr:enoyl-CoA hydratase/isomerase family protein [Paracoccus sp. AS002]MDF3907571.1 enoyl-CoA hydratase/isomerase family protein [Paracoccus sp. AS002]